MPQRIDIFMINRVLERITVGSKSTQLSGMLARWAREMLCEEVS